MGKASVAGVVHEARAPPSSAKVLRDAGASLPGLQEELGVQLSFFQRPGKQGTDTNDQRESEAGRAREREREREKEGKREQASERASERARGKI